MNKRLGDKAIRVFTAITCIYILHCQAALGGSIITDDSITDSIQGFSGFATTGANMTGLNVTATFAGNNSETSFWQETGPQSGSASGSSFSWNLSITGDTFEQPWTFTNNTGLALQRLVLDGTAALVVFDRVTNPSTANPDGEDGTPGSETGRDFITDIEFNTATYSRQIALDETPPIIGDDPLAAIGDVWHVLTIDFITPNNPEGLTNTTWSFGQDTDRDARADTIPEPSVLALFILGVTGIRYINRHTK